MLEDGRGEGAVHDRGEAPALRDFGDELQVHDLDQRVGRGFDVEPAGLGPDRLFECRPGRGRKERRGDADRLQDVLEELQRPAVEIFGGDDVIAGLQVRQQRR